MKLDVKSFGDSYQLSAAVLIYTNVATRHAFATKHEVEEHAGKPIIRPGMPFNEQDYKVLVQALAPAEQPRMQWHDPRELARGLGRMLWWSPPRKRSSTICSETASTTASRSSASSRAITSMAASSNETNMTSSGCRCWRAAHRDFRRRA